MEFYYLTSLVAGGCFQWRCWERLSRCYAVILDNMTDTKHHSNNELLAQGLGNIAAPFLGGITATVRYCALPGA